MGGRGYGGGGRGRVYTYRYTVTTRMTCIKMGSDESHFNVSLKAPVKAGFVPDQRCVETEWFRTAGLPFALFGLTRILI